VSAQPTFIIGGTLPAGTGHLYGLLSQHPDIYLAPPMQPECNFFFKTHEYEKGIDHYRTRWFSDVAGEKAIGERSSLLLSATWAPPRVAKHLPEVRLIFLFRNPVHRAYANYRFTALAGFEDRSFAEALATEEERMRQATERGRFWGEIQPHSYFTRGRYQEQLDAWLEYFPREQLLLMRSDELLADQAGGLAKIYRFLGVDDGFDAQDFSDFSSPAVIDAKKQAELRQRAPTEFDAAIQRIRSGEPPKSDFESEVRQNVRSGYEPLEPAFYRALADRFAPYNRRLAPMVPFSIEDWM